MSRREDRVIFVVEGGSGKEFLKLLNEKLGDDRPDVQVLVETWNEGSVEDELFEVMRRKYDPRDVVCYVNLNNGLTKDETAELISGEFSMIKDTRLDLIGGTSGLNWLRGKSSRKSKTASVFRYDNLIKDRINLDQAIFTTFIPVMKLLTIPVNLVLLLLQIKFWAVFLTYYGVRYWIELIFRRRVKSREAYGKGVFTLTTLDALKKYRGQPIPERVFVMENCVSFRDYKHDDIGSTKLFSRLFSTSSRLVIGLMLIVFVWVIVLDMNLFMGGSGGSGVKRVIISLMRLFLIFFTISAIFSGRWTVTGGVVAKILFWIGVVLPFFMRLSGLNILILVLYAGVFNFVKFFVILIPILIRKAIVMLSNNPAPPNVQTTNE